MANSPLLPIIEQFEEERLEFWDDDPVRAKAARFLLVAKAHAAVKQLPPRDLLLALKDLQLDDPGRLEAVRQQISSRGIDDQALALACLDADLQVHLLIADARSLSHAGQFFAAAEKYRQAEEAQRAIEQQLQPAPDSEREVQHEWHDLASLYPSLTACMEEAYRNHATQTEPLQLAQAAIRLAQIGDGSGAERTLVIAARWTEEKGPIFPILANLAGLLPHWPALQEAILQSPHDPIQALDRLTSWLNDPQRQMLSQLVSESASDGIVEDAFRADLERVIGDEWVAESQADMQTVLALRLAIAIAQENLENLERACQQIRASMKYLGATTTLRQQLSLLQAWQETRLAALESSLDEIAPFVQEPAVIGVEIVQSLEARIQLHKSILEQIKALVSAVGPATDAHLEEPGTTDEATAALEELAQEATLPAEAVPGVSQLSERTGAFDTSVALPGRNGSTQPEPLADVYRSLRGMRFSESAEQLGAAGSSAADGQERARIARLAVVTQACLAALNAGSNPSAQTVEDMIQAAGCLEADSGLDTASTWLDWSNEACPVLDDSGVRMLRREIEVRRAFRKVDQFLAEGRFVEAARSFPDASQEKNGLAPAQQGSDFWRELVADWSRKGEQKQRLLKPNRALAKLEQASEAALTSANSGDLGDALSKLAGPLQEAAALKEPDAHLTFHPLAFWLNRVLASWRDVQAIDAASQPDQSLLVLQQARLTCDHARAVTPAADFGDSLEPFDALVSKLYAEIHSRRRSVCDSLLGQLKTASDSNASLADVDRLLSSVITCQHENIDQRQIPEALRQVAAEQEHLGDSERGSKPYGIEQLASAAPFYQSARLLALFEAKNQAPSGVTPGQSLAGKLADVTAKARQIKRLQNDFDNARRDSDGVRAKELLIEAKNADLKLQEPGMVEEWDYVIESKRVLYAQNERSSRLDDLINELWSPINTTVADGELVL